MFIDTIHEFFIHLYQYKGTLRQKLFAWRIDRAFFHRTCPRPHPTDDCGRSDTQKLLATIEREAESMGGGHAQVFRLLMYRDINRRLKMYQHHMERSKQPTTCDPRFVATRA